ncbi:MAG: hypothetical protein ACLQOO_24080 [Terriglobia bacterium]
MPKPSSRGLEAALGFESRSTIAGTRVRTSWFWQAMGDCWKTQRTVGSGGAVRQAALFPMAEPNQTVLLMGHIGSYVDRTSGAR